MQFREQLQMTNARIKPDSNQRYPSDNNVGTGR
jgi:hypothetical protein